MAMGSDDDLVDKIMAPQAVKPIADKQGAANGHDSREVVPTTSVEASSSMYVEYARQLSSRINESNMMTVLHELGKKEQYFVSGTGRILRKTNRKSAISGSTIEGYKGQSVVCGMSVVGHSRTATMTILDRQ